MLPGLGEEKRRVAAQTVSVGEIATPVAELPALKRLRDARLITANRGRGSGYWVTDLGTEKLRSVSSDNRNDTPPREK